MTLVCTRWRRLFYASRRVWQQLRIIEPTHSAASSPTQAASSWRAGKRALLARVAPSMEELTIRGGHRPRELQGAQLGDSPPLGDLLLGLQPAARLRALRLFLPRLGREQAAAIASLSQLTELDVRVLSQPHMGDADALAAAGLAAAGLPGALPHLESLVLYVPSLAPSTSSGLLALTRLTRLELSASQLPAVQGLTALTRLCVLRLTECSSSGPAMAPPPAAFPRLRDYHVGSSSVEVRE